MMCSGRAAADVPASVDPDHDRLEPWASMRGLLALKLADMASRYSRIDSPHSCGLSTDFPYGLEAVPGTRQRDSVVVLVLIHGRMLKSAVAVLQSVHRETSMCKSRETRLPAPGPVSG